MILCVVLWLVCYFVFTWGVAKKSNGGYVFVHGFRNRGSLYRGASPSMVLFSYCCARIGYFCTVVRDV